MSKSQQDGATARWTLRKWVEHGKVPSHEQEYTPTPLRDDLPWAGWAAATKQDEILESVQLCQQDYMPSTSYLWSGGIEL